LRVVPSLTARALTYAVVTPTRNEAENLERLAGCLAAQTILPELWAVVDNGSTDATVEAARDVAARHCWVRVEQMPAPGEMARGAPVVRAFHRGLTLVGHVDLVVKLDADVSFENDFFERLLAEFAADPALGIAGGICLEQERGRWVPRHVTRSHVRGATRAYRSACLREILPLEERMGWDGVDELKAAVRGWTVRTIRDLPFHHHRSLAQRERAWHAWFAQGDMAHFMGYRFSYLLFRTLFRMRHQPSALAMIPGFLTARARRSTALGDPDARRYLREQQRLRQLPRRILESAGRG
jgi:glycosyltransferase involved in cell wall biosynthesis